MDRKPCTISAGKSQPTNQTEHRRPYNTKPCLAWTHSLRGTVPDSKPRPHTAALSPSCHLRRRHLLPCAQSQQRTPCHPAAATLAAGRCPSHHPKSQDMLQHSGLLGTVKEHSAQPVDCSSCTAAERAACGDWLPHAHAAAIEHLSCLHQLSKLLLAASAACQWWLPFMGSAMKNCCEQDLVEKQETGCAGLRDTPLHTHTHRA